MDSQPLAKPSGISLKKTPDEIKTIKPEEVFVFGSNLAGIHGKGAAKQAIEWKIARWGQGMGMCFTDHGSSYALPTKDYDIRRLSLLEIRCHIRVFLQTTLHLPEMNFLVTKVGCGLAGYHWQEVGVLFFHEFLNPEITGIGIVSAFNKKYPNIWLPDEFWATVD